jgi:phosphomannomutase
MSKNKIELTPQIDVDAVMKTIADKYKTQNISTIDGVKIDFPTEWVHLRKSNTEPIIRIYTEAPTQNEADVLAERFVSELKQIAGV